VLITAIVVVVTAATGVVAGRGGSMRANGKKSKSPSELFFYSSIIDALFNRTKTTQKGQEFVN
jgi:hypothetical protein